MPTDATGTPTSLGIRKYNTSADAPSGLGFNGAMDDIDALLKNLGIAGLVANDVPVYDSVAGKFKKATGTPSVATFLRGDGAWATPSGAVTFRKVTAKQVLNSVADTDLFNGEITIGANVIGATGAVRITAFGDYINNSAAARIAQQFKLKLGATTLIDSGVPVGNSQVASAVRFGWRVNATIFNLATNVQAVYFDATVTVIDSGVAAGVNNVFATGEGTVAYLGTASNTYSQVLYSGYNAGAVDTTAGQALVLSVVNPTATATYDTTLRAALVEVI